MESRHRWEGDRIPRGLLRLSVGLEDVEELWDDLCRGARHEARDRVPHLRDARTGATTSTSPTGSRRSSRGSGIQHGLVLVNPMHITAAVYVNDDEGGLIADIDDWLERLAPHEPVSGYRHNSGEDNADAHLKRQLMAHQVVLPITDGRLDLGPWEQVFYAEFDGRRRKRVVLKAIGE